MKMKTYLGDGVYAEAEVLPGGFGLCFTLSTSDGVTTTNEIVLEPYVLMALDEFRQKVRESLGE